MRVLSRQGISGVPVVDQVGSVIGVVSASDVMALAEWPEAAPAGAGHADDAALAEAGFEAGGSATPPGERGGYFSMPDGPLWHFPLARL
ncbi:MAG TPA: CBS domain-containing protein, partial [Cyclobacteriaceae bacterium]|nr:CBS domain-containing protein [Cyclobacteriaceae bacterium]